MPDDLSLLWVAWGAHWRQAVASAWQSSLIHRRAGQSIRHRVRLMRSHDHSVADINPAIIRRSEDIGVEIVLDPHACHENPTTWDMPRLMGLLETTSPCLYLDADCCVIRPLNRLLLASHGIQTFGLSPGARTAEERRQISIADGIWGHGASLIHEAPSCTPMPDAWRPFRHNTGVIYSSGDDAAIRAIERLLVWHEPMLETRAYSACEILLTAMVQTGAIDCHTFTPGTINWTAMPRDLMRQSIEAVRCEVGEMFTPTSCSNEVVLHMGRISKSHLSVPDMPRLEVDDRGQMVIEGNTQRVFTEL